MTEEAQNGNQSANPDHSAINWQARPWQDWAFLILLVCLIVITYNLVSGFQQLPSPLYGGDVYFHFGVINNIYTGNAPWTHNQFLNEYAHYPWISHLLVALIAWITGMQIMTAAIFFPVVTTALAAVISYLLGIAVFKNRSIALLYSLYWSTFQVPHTAASPFAELVIFPLFLLLLAKADDSLKSRVFAGIGFGLCGLAQVVTWIGGIMTLTLLWAWRIISDHVRYENKRFAINPKGAIKTIWKQTAWFLPIGIVGLPIALLFWGPPLLIYHGVTPNNWSEYVSYGPTLTIRIAFNSLKIWFFNSDTWMMLLLTLGSLGGLILAARSPNRFTLPLATGLVAVIGLLHPLVKEVGIGYYSFGYIYDVARGLLFFTTVYVVYKSLAGVGRTSFYCAVLIFLVVNASTTFTTFENDRWVQVGKTPNQAYELAKWIMANTPKDAVFLTAHEETGFALNAMTGRKVLIARRTHASPFVDVNQRAADAGIILYGNNSTQILDLIEKYNIKYIYEDFYSAQNQAQCAQSFDQFSKPEAADYSMTCLRANPPLENYIKQAGLTTIKVHARLDPASNVAPLFDMIAIKPGNTSLWLVNHTRLVRQVNADTGMFQRLVEITP
ncbi:MAG: hypothetical protein AABX47_07180 [Nanoarchaeota archaeon]